MVICRDILLDQDQQRDVVVVFGLDASCLFKSRAPEFDTVYTSLTVLVLLGRGWVSNS